MIGVPIGIVDVGKRGSDVRGRLCVLVGRRGKKKQGKKSEAGIIYK